MPASKYTTKLPITDSAPIQGMNTVDDPRRLPDGQCVRLLNMFPGAPPIPRNGCQGSYKTFIDKTDQFRAPIIAFGFRGSATVYAVGWIYNATTVTYSLASWPIDGSGAFTSLGAAQVSGPRFGMQSIFSNIYCFVSSQLTSWKSDTQALGNKVVEAYNIVRDMCIAEPGAISAISQSIGGGTFVAGNIFDYGFQYVRRNDATAFAAGANSANVILPSTITGQPQTVSTFEPGACIGVEKVANRKYITITDPNNTVNFTIDPTSAGYIKAVAQGATHLRVCRTHPAAATVEDAQGLTHFFLVDIALDGSTAYPDTTSDAALQDEENQLLTGYTEAPAGCYAKYFKGRLFIMDLAGKVYYSAAPGGDGFVELDMAQEYPQYAASLFAPLTQVIDCDSADGVVSSGIEILDNDIYFFKESKLWVLYGGDPSAATVTLLNNGTIGCVFPHTIVPSNLQGYGDCIFFQSNLGPAIITSGGVVALLSPFKIIELWPDRNQSELYSQLVNPALYSSAIEKCTSVFFRNTLWILYQTIYGDKKIFGFYIDPTGDGVAGALEMQLAIAAIFGFIVVYDEVNDKAYLCGTSSNYLVITEFLKKACWEDLDSEANFFQGKPTVFDNQLVSFDPEITSE